MATLLFRSPLALRLQSFFDTRRAAGRRDIREIKILRYLDRFLIDAIKPGQTITRQVAQRWIDEMKHLSPGTRQNRISILRQFCLYLSHFDPRTCIVHRSFFPQRSLFVPHIYTRKEVRRIILEAKRIGPPGSIRPAVISTLIGLLYTTGLRIGEATGLTIGDVDLKRRVLHVRETKFKKSRYVPLSASAVDHLRTFLQKRRKAGFSMASTSPFFITRTGRRYGQATLTTIFLQIVRKLGIRGPKGQRGPRIHDFRHTFAVNRLLAWYRERANLAAKLPLLSTYLGHTTVTATEVYLHATAELLEAVGKRFHTHFAVLPYRRVKPYAKA